MSEMRFPGGVWPVMLAPFTKTGAVDYEGLKQLTEWYIACGCQGLFAVCQSSEMYFLSLEERVQIAKTVVETAAGRVPVIATGNISEVESERVEETNRIAATGVDAVILITNQFATQEESDEVWLENCMSFVQQIDRNIPLGFYECPYPYKRLISLENLKACADTGRFYFLKDTCCDETLIEERLQQIEGTKLKLYNANTTTLLESLRAGAVGFSGVMANFHPRLYVYLCEHVMDENICYLQDFLTLGSLIERQYYPVNAKYHLQTKENLPIEMYSRRLEAEGLTETFKKEVSMMHELAEGMLQFYMGGGN